MSGLPPLVADLALILGSAGVITLLFKRIKQPVVLGYIIAGLLVGPNLSIFPTVTRIEDIRIWADIGIIFLLFALGLEFSLKKLVKVGGAAIITGVIEISCMLLLGYTAGKLLQWSTMDSVFLGGIVAISSTTIIFRNFNELGLRSKQFTYLVMGILIIEDIAAVIMLVLLSTLAYTQELQGWEMMTSVAKLCFFLCLWYVLGIFALPSFFRKAASWMDKETLLIVSLGLCFGMVVFAEKVGFSAALGAFLMGSLLSETSQGERIEQLIHSVKDLFGAIFFVSVGMLIDPALLAEYILPVILLTCVVIFGKIFHVTLGALIAGSPLKQSVQAGMSMSQIGEFSFIIATLGISLKVTSPFLYPIAVGVSVLTIFTTPYLMKMAVPFYDFLQNHLPQKWLSAIEKYSSGSQRLQSESDWQKLLKSFAQVMVINTVVIIGLILLTTNIIWPFLLNYFANELVGKIISTVLILALMLPFIWGLTGKKIQNAAYRNLWLNKKYNKGPLVVMEIFRNVLALVLVGILLTQLFSITVALIGTTVVMIIVSIIFRQRLQRFYTKIEKRFLQNLTEKERSISKDHLSPWDAHLVNYDIHPAATFLGKTLEELGWRERYGINLAYIERGNKVIIAPKKYEQVYPYDSIGVIGTDQQLHEFSNILIGEANTIIHDEKDNIQLQKIHIDENTKLKDKTIRDSGLRENTDGLIVGIERNGERILNPPSNTVFEWDDIVWIVADKRKLKAFFMKNT